MITGKMVSGTSRESAVDIFTFLTVIVGSIFVVVCFWILMVRAGSIIEDSLYAPSTGGEASGLYGIYKALIGEPVYQPLNEYPTTSIYNFLFYYGYGFAAKFLISKADALPIFTRFVTLAGLFGSLFVVFCYLLHEARELSVGRNARALRAVALLTPFIAYIGPFTGWWYLTARPDVMAVGFELIGLVLFLRLGGQFNGKSTVPSTFFFWLAWSMKQTAVFVWLGTLVAMSVKRRWKEIVTSMATFLLLSLVPLLLFGTSYIEHAILAPAMVPRFWEQFLGVGKEAFLTGCYVYIPGLLFIAYYLTQKRRNRTLSMLLIIFVMALTGNLLTSSIEGASRNHYFSSLLVAQLFIAQYLLSVWDVAAIEARRMLMKVLLLGFSIGLSLSSLYLIFPRQIGRVDLITPQQRQEISRVRQTIYSSDKPVFVELSYYALPWNSGQYPSDVIDWSVYRGLRKAGLVVSLEGRIRDRYYAEAFVLNKEWAQLLASSGYRRLPDVGGQIHFVR